DPVYISDWEWMFGIFEKALADLGISDGYCLSLSYPGFQATGDLVCAFGGGNPIWHKTPENEIVFGGKSDNFRIYLQAMNTWYKNGWIDKSFAEHTSDMFYMIDSAKIFSGKVGLWYGTNANLGARLFKADDPYLDGIAVSVAAQPINDIYGTAAQQNVTPFALYQTSQENLAYVITNKAADKDIETLFTFLDSLYAGDGAIVRSFGLSKEQYEVTKNKFMTENGFTEGAYSIVTDEDGVTRYQLYQSVIDAGLDGAVKAQRLPGLELISLLSIANYHKGYRANISRYVQYRNTGWLYNSFTGQLTQENSKTYAKTNTNISEFMAKNVPPFIQGKKDPYNDEDWNSYVKAINKYNPDKITDIFQQLADSMYGG
ncbi:MAG TPA: hypothetical protein DCM45_06405, partial [Clostridiales bacterium]|nr:hypothetical protein [Clostridiales bacterium]